MKNSLNFVTTCLKVVDTCRSVYPTTGKIPCEVLERFQDATGRELVRVSTENPCGIDSAEGLSEFIVFPGLVTEDF